MEIIETVVDFLLTAWPLAFPLVLFWALVRKEKHCNSSNIEQLIVRIYSYAKEKEE